MNEQYLPELIAMQQISHVVCNLSPAERKRVAAWFMDYATQEPGPPSDGDLSTEQTDEASSEELTLETASQPSSYATFEQFFEAAAPKKGAQKAAVAAYWLEALDERSSWKAFDISRLLKSIDQSVSSMSIVLTNAVKAKDPLIRELERVGESTHSRKTFCLTKQGYTYVESQLLQAAQTDMA